MDKPLYAIRIAELRNAKELTQQQLADILKLTRGRLNNYEQGIREPDYTTLQNIADFFGVTVDYLLGRDTEYAPQAEKKPKDLLKFLDESEVMFDGVPLTEEDKEKVRKALELAFWDAKQQNKRKKS